MTGQSKFPGESGPPLEVVEQRPTAPIDSLFLTPSEVAHDAEISGLKREIEELKKERDRHGWGTAIHKEWGMGDFYGPCAHGRDPYTRCDDCEGMTPAEAFAEAHRTAEREACALVAEACEPALWCPPWRDAMKAIAAAIRARGGGQ